MTFLTSIVFVFVYKSCAAIVQGYTSVWPNVTSTRAF